MSYSHLINCVLLSFGPYFVCYRAKNLSDFNAFKVCIFAAVAYLLTMICKMILLASIMSTDFEGSHFDFLTEINKNFFNLIDCVGIFALLQYRGSFLDTSHIRTWAVTIGWGLCESICINFFYYFLHATGEEFSWKYISKASICNLEILETYSMVVLLAYLARSLRRHEAVFSPRNIIAFALLIAKCVIFTTYSNFLGHKNDEDEINVELIVSKAVFGVLMYGFVEAMGYPFSVEYMEYNVFVLRTFRKITDK